MNIGLDTSGVAGGQRVALADVDLNGVVDLVDFRIIKENRSASVGAFSIPEPASFTLLSLSAVATLALRRRRFS